MRIAAFLPSTVWWDGDPAVLMVNAIPLNRLVNPGGRPGAESAVKTDIKLVKLFAQSSDSFGVIDFRFFWIAFCQLAGHFPDKWIDIADDSIAGGNIARMSLDNKFFLLFRCQENIHVAPS